MKNRKHSAANMKMAPREKSPVHNTSGAVMPNPERRSMQSEKDVQDAFKTKPESKSSKKNH